MKHFLSLFLIALSLTAFAKTPVYKDAKAPVDKRVEDLLRRMTLEEKIGQLNQRSFWDTPDGHTLFFGMIRDGKIGSFMNVTNPVMADSIQRIALTHTRLGIPVLLARDVIHGYKTIFPIPLGQAATFSTEVARDGARVAAREASTDGIRWTFAPMIDIARDPRWGRIAEGCGEDPYLTSQMARAMVEGFQNAGVAACAKHFVAYGAAEGGRDYNTTGVAERELRQTYLPPFKTATEAGAMTFMASFNANDGMPSSCNRHLLTDILRGEWGFKGFVVSDCFSVRELVSHGVAATEAAAAGMCLSAGLDMDMEDSLFIDNILAQLKEGKVKESDINRAVRGILRTKFLLGLFEDPYVHTPQSFKYAPAHLAAAKRAALQSAILLKNDSATLPISVARTPRVLLTGPLADAPYDQLGTWIFDGEKEHTVTLRAALEAEKGLKLIYEPALRYSREVSPEGIERALAAAANADIIVAAIGEEAILSGEGHALAELNLVGGQSELVSRLKATGKPLVLVVMAGRPLTIGKEMAEADAVLYSFHPGTMGGPALADLLLGRESPSGKTPVTFPSTSGQCPIYYNHAQTGRPATGAEIGLSGIPEEAGNTFLGCTSYYLDAGHLPLIPFGYGLSYTTFTYSPVTLSGSKRQTADGTPVYPFDGAVTATFTLTNTGSVRATEVVQLYTRDLVASVTPSVRDLRRFERVTLRPGESRTVSFTLPISELSFVGHDLKPRLEPGEFTLGVGGSSLCPLTEKFQIAEK